MKCGSEPTPTYRPAHGLPPPGLISSGQSIQEEGAAESSGPPRMDQELTLMKEELGKLEPIQHGALQEPEWIGTGTLILMMLSLSIIYWYSR